MSFSKMLMAKKGGINNNSTKQSVTVIMNGQNSSDLYAFFDEFNVVSSNSNNPGANFDQQVNVHANLFGAKRANVKRGRMNSIELNGQAAIGNVTQSSNSKMDMQNSEDSVLFAEKNNTFKADTLVNALEMTNVNEMNGNDSTNLKMVNNIDNTIEMTENGLLENEPITDTWHILHMQNAKNPKKEEQIKVVRANVMRLIGADGVREFQRNGQNWEEVGQQGPSNMFED